MRSHSNIKIEQKNAEFSDEYGSRVHYRSEIKAGIKIKKAKPCMLFIQQGL